MPLWIFFFFLEAQPPTRPVTKWDPLKCCHFFFTVEGEASPLYISSVRSTTTTTQKMTWGPTPWVMFHIYKKIKYFQGAQQLKKKMKCPPINRGEWCRISIFIWKKCNKLESFLFLPFKWIKVGGGMRWHGERICRRNVGGWIIRQLGIYVRTVFQYKLPHGLHVAIVIECTTVSNSSLVSVWE